MASTSTTAGQQLLVDLINTLHRPDGVDALEGQGAGEWLSTHGAEQEPRPEAGARRLDDLRQVREGLRQLALANNGRAPQEDVVVRAEQVLAAVPMRLRLTGPLHLSVHPAAGAGDPVAQVMAAVAEAYLTGNATGTWSRVKACADLACAYAYTDSSRNASRRWCYMAGCGNKAKQVAWRSRRSVGSGLESG